MQSARAQQPISKNMPAIRIGTKLDFIDRYEIGPNVQWHRLGRADPILRAGGDNPFLARHQGHDRWAAQGHNLIIDFARQKPQRQADHACAMAQHLFNRIMGFARIGRAKHRGHARRGTVDMHDIYSA